MYTSRCLRIHRACGSANSVCAGFCSVGEDMLNKYGVKANNAILAEPKHMPMYDLSMRPNSKSFDAPHSYEELVQKYPVQYIAGGVSLDCAHSQGGPLQAPRRTRSASRNGCCRFPAPLPMSALLVKTSTPSSCASMPPPTELPFTTT